MVLEEDTRACSGSAGDKRRLRIAHGTRSNFGWPALGFSDKVRKRAPLLLATLLQHHMPMPRVHQCMVVRSVLEGCG